MPVLLWRMVLSSNFTLEETMIINEPLPGLTRVQTANIVSFFSDITCGEGCWNAHEEVCKCSCGGKNHGIHLRGGNAVRNCKINGRRYELVAVGTHSDLWDEACERIKQDAIESGKAWYENDELMETTSYFGEPRTVKYRDPVRKDCLGDYELKYATLSQCLKWSELAYFGIADDRDRYHANAAILWRRVR